MSLLKILFKDRTHINDGWPGTPFVFGSDCELLVKHHLKKNALLSKFEDSYGYTEKPYPKKNFSFYGTCLLNTPCSFSDC